MLEQVCHVDGRHRKEAREGERERERERERRIDKKKHTLQIDSLSRVIRVLPCIFVLPSLTRGVNASLKEVIVVHTACQ
jgi:hypothetical protein